MSVVALAAVRAWVGATLIQRLLLLLLLLLQHYEAFTGVHWSVHCTLWFG